MFKLHIYNLVGTEQYFEITGYGAFKYIPFYNNIVPTVGMHVITDITKVWMLEEEAFEFIKKHKESIKLTSDV